MEKKVWLSLLVLVLTLGSASSQNGITEASNVVSEPFEDFFDRDEVMDITLTFDLKNFERTKDLEEYHQAILTVKESDSSLSHEYSVRIRTRGTFRKSYCTTPPFWLNITRSAITADALFGVKKMKIVTQCREKGAYSDYVLKEYLVYKLYNIITPYSFKVRLLRITYIDTGRENEQSYGWAFAIEPEDLMARRLDGDLVNNNYLAKRSMNNEQMDRLSMFHYMIGNTDYSITGRHNVEILSLNGGKTSGYVPIPYDFDFTGFVNTEYASPANNIHIKDVRNRYYTGLCRDDESFEALIREFNGFLEAIDVRIQEFEYLHPRDKREITRYIDSFFDQMNSERFINRELRLGCE